MIKQITVDELRPGMFIHKLDVWWIKDKRIRNQMLVTDPRQIAMLPSSRGILQTGNLAVYRDFIDVEHVVDALWALTHNPAAHGVGRAELDPLLDLAGE